MKCLLFFTTSPMHRNESTFMLTTPSKWPSFLGVEEAGFSRSAFVVHVRTYYATRVKIRHFSDECVIVVLQAVTASVDADSTYSKSGRIFCFCTITGTSTTYVKKLFCVWTTTICKPNQRKWLEVRKPSFTTQLPLLSRVASLRVVTRCCGPQHRKFLSIHVIIIPPSYDRLSA